MIEIGKRNQLAVSRESAHGIFLDAGELGEILLPGRPPSGADEGVILDAFVYRDSEDRLVATLDAPKAMVGEFAVLKVVNVNRQIGAFLDWGLPKDLLLPFREQRDPVREGGDVLVYIHLDEKSDRIVATTRFKKHLSTSLPPYAEGQAVNVVVAERTPMGYGVIVEGAYYGMLYHANLAGPLLVGQKLGAFVGAVRPDGKVDLRLDAAGYQRVASLTEQILSALEQNGGKLPLDDGSDPAAIREAFGVSKKAFKQALGALFKKRRIRFEAPGTVLVEKVVTSGPRNNPRSGPKSQH
ncbi:S1-like domain-containing RNA-binding protein [soil metagenome]